MAASLFAGCGTGTGTETSASDNSKTEETGQTTSDDPYAAYAGTTISVAAIETGYGSQMWQEVTDAFTEETGIQVELTTDKKLEDVIDHPCREANTRMLFIWPRDVKLR